MTIFNNIGIVLLAAGSSSRMRRNKLLEVFQHKTLLENAVSAGLESKAKSLVVVSGAHSPENRSLIASSRTGIVYNKNWEKGIGTSIKCGLEALLKKHAEIQAVIISVCDQPYLTSEVFDKMMDTYLKTGKQIIASAYKKTTGVPVLYDKSLFDELLKLPDAHGAKRYIVEKASADNLTTVPFPKGEIDIDTLEDLKKLSQV